MTRGGSGPLFLSSSGWGAQMVDLRLSIAVRDDNIWVYAITRLRVTATAGDDCPRQEHDQGQVWQDPRKSVQSPVGRDGRPQGRNPLYGDARRRRGHARD